MRHLPSTLKTCEQIKKFLEKIEMSSKTKCRLKRWCLAEMSGQLSHLQLQLGLILLFLSGRESERRKLMVKFSVLQNVTCSLASSKKQKKTSYVTVLQLGCAFQLSKAEDFLGLWFWIELWSCWRQMFGGGGGGGIKWLSLFCCCWCFCLLFLRKKLSILTVSNTRERLCEYRVATLWDLLLSLHVSSSW